MTAGASVASAPASTSGEGADYLRGSCRRPVCSADPAFWPGVLSQLSRYARSLGLAEPDAQDVAQETITRALERDLRFSDQQDLLRWCQVVVRHLAVDLYRQRQRCPLVAAPSVLSLSGDPGEVAALRDLLRRVVQQLTALPPGQRQAIGALLVESPPAGRTRKDQVRLAVARTKARRTLRQATGYGAPALAAAALLVRRLTRPRVLLGGLAALVAVGLLAAPPGPGHRGPVPRPPASVLRPAGVSFPGAAARRPAAGPPREVAGAASVRVAEIGSSAPAHHLDGGTRIAGVQRFGLVAGLDSSAGSGRNYLVCVGGGALAQPVCVVPEATDAPPLIGIRD